MLLFFCLVTTLSQGSYIPRMPNDKCSDERILKCVAHSFGHFFYTDYTLQVMEKLKSIPADFGHTLDRSPVTSPSQGSHRDKEPFTLTVTLIFRLTTWASSHVFGLWEKTRAPGGNPPRNRKNMQIPHRKEPLSDPGIKPGTKMCCYLTKKYLHLYYIYEKILR